MEGGVPADGPVRWGCWAARWHVARHGQRVLLETTRWLGIVCGVLLLVGRVVVLFESAERALHPGHAFRHVLNFVHKHVQVL